MSPRAKLSKDKLQKIILAGIVTAIGGAAMYIFWISPNLESVTANRAKAGKLQEEIQQIERKAKLESVNQPMLQQIQAFVEPLFPRTVNGDAYMWVVLQVNELTEGRSIKVPTPRPGGRSAHPRVAGYELLSTSIEVEGDYDQIGAFLRDFENLYPLGEVRMLELNPVGTGPTRRALVEVRFLVWPEDKLKIKPEAGKKS